MVADTLLIKQNIRNLKHNFIRKHSKEPDTVYLSYDLVYLLHDENPYTSVLKPETIEGMKVVRVSELNHVSVAITEELEET